MFQHLVALMTLIQMTKTCLCILEYCPSPTNTFQSTSTISLYSTAYSLLCKLIILILEPYVRAYVPTQHQLSACQPQNSLTASQSILAIQSEQKTFWSIHHSYLFILLPSQHHVLTLLSWYHTYSIKFYQHIPFTSLTTHSQETMLTHLSYHSSAF